MKKMDEIIQEADVYNKAASYLKNSSQDVKQTAQDDFVKRLFLILNKDYDSEFKLADQVSDWNEKHDPFR